MIDIRVKYQNFPALEIELIDHPLSQAYKDLIRRNDSAQALSRDPAKYNVDYLRKRSQEAKERLGWDWVKETYDLPTTTVMHKDIETYLAKGFQNIPEAFDELLHELHYTLHAIQGHNVRGDWVQVEWFNDDGITMPDDFKFVTELKFGDVKFQNPFVGHDPSFVYRQQDHTNISQTCKFHNLVRPGLNMMIKDYNFTIDENYLPWFKKHASTWVDQHGADKILRYTGWPKIGQVINTDVLASIINEPTFTFESIEVL